MAAAVLPEALDNGSTDRDGYLITFSLNPPGPFPGGSTTLVTLTGCDPSGACGAAQATITVVDTQPPAITCPAGIVVANDPGLTPGCGALSAGGHRQLWRGRRGLRSGLGLTFSKGTTTVNCTATDDAGCTASCSFTVTVEDREAPRVAVRPAANPADKTIPAAGNNPRSGQNPDGFYQLLTKDNCDAAPKLYVKDSAGSFVAGPYANGDTVKITRDRTATPLFKKMAGGVVAHIILRGDALVYAIDADGNASTPVSALVPPTPK